jgi:hypothetical protein
MDKSAFKPDCRYTVAWRDAGGRVRPANLYVYRTYDKFMIARMLGGDGLLRKIAYQDVEKIVREQAVGVQEQFYIPAAVLEEKVWQDRSVMQRYSSSPDLGK